MMSQPRCTVHNAEAILAENKCKEAFQNLPDVKATGYQNFRRSAFFLVLLSLLFVGCYHSSDLFKKSHTYTLEDKKEAQVIAFCLSGTITAPDSLSNRVLMNLAEIRSDFAAEFRRASYGDDGYMQNEPIRFMAPWVPSCIIMAFEPGTAQLVAKGQYHEWDDLNELYRVSTINLRSIKNSWAILNFKGQLHSRRLCELYAALPGVRIAHPNFYGGGSSWIYPSSHAGSGLTYLFSHGWGDCPSGCIYGEYWYFIAYESGETIFVGYWNPRKDPVQPDWWSDAKLNIEQYRAF